jgi:hypothetical protein
VPAVQKPAEPRNPDFEEEGEYSPPAPGSQIRLRPGGARQSSNTSFVATPQQAAAGSSGLRDRPLFSEEAMNRMPRTSGGKNPATGRPLEGLSKQPGLSKQQPVIYPVTVPESTTGPNCIKDGRFVASLAGRDFSIKVPPGAAPLSVLRVQVVEGTMPFAVVVGSGSGGTSGGGARGKAGRSCVVC